MITQETLINEIEQLVLHAEENEHLTYGVLEHARKLVFTARQEPKNGIELIAQERQEQIEKHGRTIERDVTDNSRLQLSDAAGKLCSDDVGGYWGTSTLPIGWNQAIWDKMTNKPYKDRLIIAGALIAAEIDRLQNS